TRLTAVKPKFEFAIAKSCTPMTTAARPSSAKNAAKTPSSVLSFMRQTIGSAAAGTKVPSLTRVDWIAVIVVAVTALGGLRRGLIGTAFSLAGIAGGAIAGARVAPHVLHGGTSSPYLPVAALAGAVVRAVLLQSVAATIASF